MAHLHTGGKAPPEYITLVMCRDVFHCTPSQLRQEKASDILVALKILSMEEKHRQNQSSSNKPRTRSR